MLTGMSSAEFFRRVDVHGEDLRAISDTVIEIHDDVVQLKDDVAEIKTEHGRLLAAHSVTLGEHGTKLDELSSKLDAVLALLAPGKDTRTRQGQLTRITNPYVNHDWHPHLTHGGRSPVA